MIVSRKILWTIINGEHSNQIFVSRTFPVKHIDGPAFFIAQVTSLIIIASGFILKILSIKLKLFGVFNKLMFQESLGIT